MEISVEEAIKDLQEDITEKQNQIELIKNIDWNKPVNEETWHQICDTPLRTSDLLGFLVKNIFPEAENINISKLQGYTKSDLWQELKNAKEIQKEKAFYINVKASRMYDISKENDENILVQGIIDLYYIDKDGKLVLVDYKTDYVEAGKENELVEKYKEQLYLYKDALEKALNRKVDRMWIYSLYLNESIVIEK